MRPSCLLALVIAALPAFAGAQHPITGRLSRAGLDFLERALPQEIPNPVVMPDTTVQADLACPVVITQQNTQVVIGIDAFDLEIPRDGLLEIRAVLDLTMTGEIILDNAFCDGYAPLCDDRIDVEDVATTVGFTVSYDAAAGLSVDVAEVVLDLTEDRLDIVLSNCLIEPLANDVIARTKGLVIDLLTGQVAELAQTQLAPQIQALLAAFDGSFEFDAGLARLEVNLTDVTLAPAGISIEAEADVTSSIQPAECLGPDPGEPGTQSGARPDFAALDPEAHLGLSVNLGALDDLFYHVWRTGLACVNGDQLADYGIALDFGELISVLPGLPPGTRAALELRLAQPPTVSGATGADALLTLTLPDVEIDFFNTLPDGESRPLFLDLDAEVKLRARYDRDLNAIALRPESVTIGRLDVMGAPEVAGRLDAPHLQRAVEEKLGPAILRQLGVFALALPLPGFGGYHVVPRTVGTTAGHVWVAVDLYRAPDLDETAPETSIAAVPPAPVRVSDARVLASGQDDLVPLELLRFVATVDGVAGEPSFLREIAVGTAGQSGTHQIAVAAVDLAGNIDPTPAQVELLVDGIAPHLYVQGDGARRVKGAMVELAWAMTDDLTSPSQLQPSVTIDRLTDPQDPWSNERINVVELPAGATTSRVQLAAGGHFVLGVTVRDEAGNETVQKILVATETGSGCGCASGASGSPLGLLVLLALALVRLRRSPVKS